MTSVRTLARVERKEFADLLESLTPQQWSMSSRVSLNFARVSPVIGGTRRTRGVRLVATDMDWSAGHGPEVRGSGEALLLAITGRAELIDELDGEGVTLLR